MMKAESGHWYRIRFLGGPLESPRESARMLKVIIEAMAGRARRAAATRAAGGMVTVRPARIYAHREDEVIVWHLDDGALSLYRLVDGHREPDAHVAALPDVDGMRRVLSGRYYTESTRQESPVMIEALCAFCVKGVSEVEVREGDKLFHLDCYLLYKRQRVWTLDDSG